MPGGLPIKVKAGYGWAETGLYSIEMLVRLYLLKFYTDQVGLRPDLAGLAVGLAVIWDAVSDPLMGTISDRTKHSIGKRRIYILPGSILAAFSLLTLFYSPESASQAYIFLYLLFNYLLLNTAITIVAVPHAALGAELTEDTHERTVLFGFRLFLGNIGLLAGTLIPGIFLDQNPETAWGNTSLAIAILLMVSSLITYFTTSGYDHAAQPDKYQEKFSLMNHFRSLAEVLKNPFFRPLLAAFLIAYIGVSINSTLALFYYDIRLNLNQNQINMILGVFILVWSLSIAFWVLLSKKKGKKGPAFWGIFLLGVMTFIAYPLFPPGNPHWPLAASIAGGILVGAIVLLDSLVADIVDYDHLKSGQKREGLYFGFWKMSIKLSRAIAIALSGILLQWAGYNGTELSREAQGERIAFLFGPVVGTFFAAGALIFLAMPLTAEKHAQVQRILIKKKEKFS